MRFLKLQLNLSLFDLLVRNAQRLQEVNRLKNVDAVLQVDWSVHLFNFTLKHGLHVLLMVLNLKVLVIIIHIDFVTDRRYELRDH